MEKLKFEVGGQAFVISRNLLKSGPDSGLKELCTSEHDVVLIDRPPDAFAAILALYQTGELHLPKTCCPGAFLLELEYWGVQTDKLAKCCSFKLQRFKHQQDHLKKFQANMQERLKVSKGTPSEMCPTINSVRSKIWNIVDFKQGTVLSTLYFGVSLIMVFVSVCNLAISTDNAFRRNMTFCEQYEYMKRTNMEDFEHVASYLESSCNRSISPNAEGPVLQIDESESDYAFVKINVLSEIPEPTSDYDPNLCEPEVNSNKSDTVTDKPSKDKCKKGGSFNPIPIFGPSLEIKRIKIPNFKIPIEIFGVIEFGTTIYFTVDVAVRLLTCPSFIQYFKSVINMADLSALLGAYLHWFLVSIRLKEKYEMNWIDLFACLQMLRSFRLFRLVLSFNISKVLLYSIKQSIKDGFIMILILVAGMCTFSTGLFLSEDKETVKTLPEAWYWSVITMTTVGYGDISPKTALGRLVACVCSVSGVLMFALTIPLFVNQFLTLHQFADMKFEENKDDGKENNAPTSIQVDKKPPKKNNPIN